MLKNVTTFDKALLPAFLKKKPISAKKFSN